MLTPVARQGSYGAIRRRCLDRLLEGMPLRALLPAALLTALPAAAEAQTVTYAELEGAVVQASVTYHQVRRSDGEDVSGLVRQDWRFVIGSGERIQYESTITAFFRRGSRSSTPETGTARLGRPGQTAQHGGGDGVWVFANGTLTFLRTYRGEGGYKRSIHFSRSPSGYSCTIKTAFARENGRGAIRFTSPVDGGRVEMLSAKTVSSSCRVAKS